MKTSCEPSPRRTGQSDRVQLLSKPDRPLTRALVEVHQPRLDLQGVLRTCRVTSETVQTRKAQKTEAAREALRKEEAQEARRTEEAQEALRKERLSALAPALMHRQAAQGGPEEEVRMSVLRREVTRGC